MDKTKIRLADTLVKQAGSLIEQHKYAEALAVAAEAIQRRPDYAPAWHVRGLAFAHLDKQQDAVAAYDKAIALDANNAQAWDAKGDAHMHLEQYDEALKAYECALALVPGSGRFLNDVGTAHYHLGHIEYALAYFRKAVAIAPNDATIWCNQGYAYLSMGEWDDAISRFEKALDFNPDFQPALDGISKARKKSKSGRFWKDLTVYTISPGYFAPGRGGRVPATRDKLKASAPDEATRRKEASPTSKKEEEQREQEPADVAFTSYYPREVSPGAWESLLVFIALDDPHTAARVAEQAAERLRQRTANFRNLMVPSQAPLRRGTRLTIVPSLQGFRFDPASVVAEWKEDVQCYEFRLWADLGHLGQAAHGVVQILEGPLLRGEIPISVYVRGAPSARTVADLADAYASAHAAAYRNTFPSYSHKDGRVVQAFEAVVQASGDRYLRDVHMLRAGQQWSPTLLELIGQADVFQLFWSESAARSSEVEREWRHALTILPSKAASFIRPVYWTRQPSPIPNELRPIEFGHVEPELLGIGRPSWLGRLFGS